MDRQNFGLRDEIKAYWSARAETFDLQPGHEIFSEAERSAWHRLIEKHLGKGSGRRALDLASGTGVVSLLMDDLGYRVTGIDWSEPMLERARAKATARGRSIRFRMADAENTLEPDAAYDVIVTRHLVWTLVDPEAAFAEWLRILKPGGRILIVDGDWVTLDWRQRLLKRLAAGLQRAGLVRPEPKHTPATFTETHNRILAQVHFSRGAGSDAVTAMLAAAGFQDLVVDRDLRAIHRAQAPQMTRLAAWSRALQHRYAIRAEKPAVTGAPAERPARTRTGALA